MDKKDVKKLKRVFDTHVTPYEKAAAARIGEYDRLKTEDIYQGLWPHLSGKTGALRVLDIGAGSGRDAMWFAGQGHHVVAVEPADTLRASIAEKATKQKSGTLDVRDGMMPDMSFLKTGERFDVILLGAVWQHVAPKHRRTVFNALANVMADDGVLYILLRHGPAPADRKMYQVSASEVSRFAKENALDVLACDQSSRDLMNRNAVTWSQFAARKPKR